MNLFVTLMILSTFIPNPVGINGSSKIYSGSGDTHSMTTTILKSPKATGKIFGEITDYSSDLPIQGAKIEILESLYTLVHTTYSDQNGYYLIKHLPRGKYQIRVSKDDYDQIMLENILVQPGPTNVSVIKKDFCLTKIGTENERNRGTIAFRVRNKRYNSPVKDYNIHYLNRNQKVVTDSTGIFYFDHLPPGVHDFLLHEERFYTHLNYPEVKLIIADIAEEYPRSDTIWYDHYINHPAYDKSDRIPVKGVVTNHRGKPVPNAKIVFFPYDYSVITDSKGKYDYLIPEGRYTIQIVAAGYHLYEEELEFRYNPVHINLNSIKDFALEKKSRTKGDSGIIAGFVYDSYCQTPQLNVSVYLLDCGYSTTTDSNGYFLFTGVPNGVHELEVSDLGMQVYTRWVENKRNNKDTPDTLRCYLNPIRITNHPMNVKFDGRDQYNEQYELYDFKGRLVYQPSGVAVAATPVFLIHQDDSAYKNYYSVTSRNGDFVFKVPHGDYQLEIKTPITDQFEKRVSISQNISDMEICLDEIYSTYPISGNYNRISPNNIKRISVVSDKTTDYNENMGTLDVNFNLRCYNLASGQVINGCNLLNHQLNANVSNDKIIRMNDNGFTAINYAIRFQRNLGIYHPLYQTETLNPQYYFNGEDLYVSMLPDSIKTNYYGEKVQPFYQTKFSSRKDHWAPSIHWYFEYCMDENKTNNPHLQGKTTFIHGTPYIDSMIGYLSLGHGGLFCVEDTHLTNQYNHVRFYITMIDGKGKPVTRTITLRKNYLKTFPNM